MDYIAIMIIFDCILHMRLYLNPIPVLNVRSIQAATRKLHLQSPTIVLVGFPVTVASRDESYQYKFVYHYPPVNWHRPWQIGVGRLVSFKKWWFSGSMLIYWRVIPMIFPWHSHVIFPWVMAFQLAASPIAPSTVPGSVFIGRLAFTACTTISCSGGGNISKVVLRRGREDMGGLG